MLYEILAHDDLRAVRPRQLDALRLAYAMSKFAPWPVEVIALNYAAASSHLVARFLRGVLLPLSETPNHA